MAITAGVISQVSVSSTTISMIATAATLGVGPYTYQWYMSTESGFSPGGGNIVAGATDLSETFTGLIPNTTYYFKVVATDTGDSNTTVTYTQVASVTAPQTLSQNQFAQSEYIGTLDLRLNFNTIAAQIDISQTGTLYSGMAVKLVDSAGGVPKVVGCTSNSDIVFGFINYNIKNQNFIAGNAAELSISGNVMYLYSTTAIARGQKVTIDLSTGGGVAAENSGDTIVGWAYDKFTAPGQLGRIYITTPGFEVAS